ncbi:MULTISPECIES: hypothetical protein [unclassified Streptomyces]|uniref:Lipoprotein n=1 Tax=Streptomyces sp. NBC_00119 TaxID=2975659 RepID=A0AAU1U732_9ACTN|nr:MULTISPECIES: hypothetical protein [unclassified Streptomyces]MCX4643809.1 hypothetical protein [Streptomyces sp. NBC_01446]MCX5324919.1 hypothetical protein [Streptomyces sp. NBC_00120]
MPPTAAGSLIGPLRESDISAIRTTTLTAAGCAALLLATTSACGTVENLTAGQKIDKAADRLGEQKSLSFELGLDAKPDALMELAGGQGDEAMPPAVAKTFAGAHVTFSVRSKKPLSDSGEKDFVGMGMKVSVPGGTLAEYRLAGDFVYFRLDMQKTSELMGFPVPSPKDLPKGEEGLAKALEGEWVKVDLSDVRKSTSGKGSDDSKGSGGLDEKTQRKVLKALRGAIADDVTLRSAGTEDGTERIVAKASFRELLTDLVDKLGPLKDELPPGAGFPTAKDLADAPAKKVAVDFSITNGALSKISFDLAALGDGKKGGKVPLVLKFGKAGDISAPSGATEVPLGELAGGNPFMSGAAMGGF